MAFDNTVTITGNVTRDPELRFISDGTPLCNFGVAWNKRNQNGDDEAMFFEVTCWRNLAENVAESIGRGDRVVVSGRLNFSNWETDEGEKRSKVDIIAEEVGPSLKWATAEVSRTPRSESDGGDSSFTQAQAAPSSDFSTDSSDLSLIHI